MRQGIGDWTNDPQKAAMADPMLREWNPIKAAAGAIGKVRAGAQQLGQDVTQGWEDTKAIAGNRQAQDMSPEAQAQFAQDRQATAQQRMGGPEAAQAAMNQQFAAHQTEMGGTMPTQSAYGAYDPSAAESPEAPLKPAPTPAEASPDAAADGAETDVAGGETASGDAETQANTAVDKLSPEAKKALLDKLTAELGGGAAPAPATGREMEVAAPAAAPAGHASQTPGAINPATGQPWSQRTIKRHAAPAPA